MQQDTVNQAILGFAGAPSLASAGSQTTDALFDSGGTSLWLDERLLPAYAAALSLLVLVLSKHLPGGTAPDKDHDTAATNAGFIARRGGWPIFACKLLRLASVLALLALSATVALAAHPLEWSCAPYLAPLIYAALLALLNVSAAAPAAATYSRHLTLVTLALFAVYALRDLWPLMTFNARPADGAEGARLWAKVALAAFAGVLEPLLEPYPYLPDAKDAQKPNPEQTASLASFLLYVFLDPLMWRAYRVPHLPHSELPPLPQKEAVARVLRRSAGALDPAASTKRGHLFFAFLRVFRAEFAQETGIVLVQAAVRLAGPVGVNQLLRYLENKEAAYAAPARVRPWVWILWLALGPVADTLLGQLQQYISYTVVVRTEALVTARVFEHALRIRLKAESGKDGAEEKTQNLVGRINTLVTGDLAALGEARDVLALAVLIPAQVALGTWFLYTMLGWSVFVGMAVMVALAPVPARFAALIGDVTKEKMQATDARVQAVTEVLSVLRMIKLFGWRPLAEADIAARRDAELRLIWRSRAIGFANFFVNHSIPLVHMIVTYLIFTLVMKRNLTASIVFSSMTAFKILRNSLFQILDVVPTAVATKVSLERLADFLWNTELLDAFDATPAPAPPAAHAHDIGFAHADFLWSKTPSPSPSTNPTSTSPPEPFRLHITTPVLFARGALSLVVGPTGAGKTSLLLALLGELHCVPRPGGWVHLPRAGGVAYAAQESWVRSATIRENIVLDQPFDEERYKKVLYQCALREDLRLLEAGDETEVGERGLTLSGGQKARVTLARAVYSKAEILLLDDVFAALDVHTSRWIAERCLAGDLLKGRTVILITHNVALTMSLAQFVVSLGADGTIAKQGSPAEVFAGDPALAEHIRHEQQALELDELEEREGETKADDPAKEGKLVVAEEIAVGRVSWKAIKMFLAALGGDWPLLFWTQVFIGLGVSEFFDVVEMWWLGRWAHQYVIQPHDQVRVTFYLIIYCVIIVSVVLASTWGTLFWTYGATGASRRLNAYLMSSVLRSTFRWLDVTPVSRVINRCTQDIRTVDGPVQGNLYVFFIVTSNMLIKLTAVIVYTPVFVVPALFAVAVGALFGHMYVRAQMSVKRELSNAKSPVIGVFSGAMDGLVSIRAYHAQEFFREELLQRIDYYSCAARVFNNLQRWISVRIDLLSAVFSFAVAFYLVYGGSIQDSSTVGFILTVAVTFTEMVLWCVQMYNGFEVNANSLERIYQYLHIEHEPASGIVPPAYWPASGTLQVEKLTARYSQDGPEILHGLTFTVNAGERIGVVGRTGSGKSTLTLALLRCIPTDGLVTFDGMPTATLDLDALRSAVTVIPQMPELMSGSLRHNLDPFGQHDDATLNDALRASGFTNSGGTNEGGNLGLDSQIAERGANLSVGQRQIVALARAIVRRSKLLILDEATSAIDYETDAIIQRSLRNELKDVTVITVAHRLQTIMDYDKIMVLDAGHLAEFDTPKALLKKKDGLLHALVEESSDKAALYAMAGAG